MSLVVKRNLSLVMALVGLVMVMFSVTATRRGIAAPTAVHAAPTHSIREFYIPVSVLFTVVMIPATATITDCLDVGGPAIGYQSGCMLIVDSPDGDPAVARLFRGQRVGSVVSPSQFDFGVEHVVPGAAWFQRSGTGFTQRFVILETN